MIGACSRLGRLARTVAHLRPAQALEQVKVRALRPWRGNRIAATLPAPPLRSWTAAWDGPAFLPPRQVAAGRFRILNVEAPLADPASWNDPQREKLWLYNLHYLDDLALPDTEIEEAQQAAFNRWIAENPPPAGIGWQPYPLSMRIVNAVKWRGRRGATSSAQAASLAQQARALRIQVEHHVLANHLFANGKALAFAGAFFAGAEAERWLTEAAALLARETEEQFLLDGGHFERSPMYHCLLLWDVCDLLELARCTGLEPLARLAPRWKRVLDHGLRWLAAIAHPDGRIPFFNDAAFDVAPTPTQLHDYAGRFLPLEQRDRQPTPILCLLRQSGFAAADLGDGCKLLADIGSIGPDYQPGHAHAETLAFELSIRGHRVFVNSGTSTYEPGPERLFERSTAAHNTVEVAGRDSSEVWAAFRVGRRARVFGLQAWEGPDGVEIAASHDGYRHLPGRPVHRRTLQARPGEISVADEVSITSLPAVARFHLHPAVEVGEGSTLRLPDSTVIRWSAEGGPCRVTKGRWRPCFGRAEPNHCIEVPLLGGRQRFLIRWGA
jgi:uncharacterized heparinase superfamily protein